MIIINSTQPLRLISKPTTRCRPFSTPAVPKKTNALGVQAVKPWSELSTPQKGKQILYLTITLLIFCSGRGFKDNCQC